MDHLKEFNEELHYTNSTTEKQLDQTHFEESDGGYGWVVVLSSFLIHCVIFGVMNVYGIYLAHYSKFEFKDADLSLLSLIGGLGPGIYALFSIVTGTILSHLGHRLTIIIGAASFCAGLIISSFATQAWHLVIGQALLVGIGVSMCFITAISVPPAWFNKYRGLAIGLCASGSGIGGLVLSPITQVMIDELGFRWALRITAIISAVILVSCAFLMKVKVPLQKSTAIVDWGVIRDFKFIWIYLMGAFIGFMYWVPYFLMPLYCSDFGLTASQAAVVVGLLNGGSAIGRIVMGKVSDMFGNVNSLIFSNLIMGLTFPAIWYYSTQYWSLIVFGIIFGIFSGGFFTIIALLPPQLFDLQKLPLVNGPLYSCLTIGYITGTTIANEIIRVSPTLENYNGVKDYKYMMIYLFLFCLASCICLLPLKFKLNRNVFAKI